MYVVLKRRRSASLTYLSVPHTIGDANRWLLYHTEVHGLEKTFVYDNDNNPDVDDLKSTVAWLSEYFDVEYVPWHVHKTQIAYHGHCVMRAAPQCRWVSFIDTDEFLHVGVSMSLLIHMQFLLIQCKCRIQNSI